MPALARRARRSTNIWPGFVDALATLLIVIIFILLIFVIAQFYLSEALSGRDTALDKLNSQVSELADLLALERKANTDLRLNAGQLSEELQASVTIRDELTNTIQSLNARAEKAEATTDSLNKSLSDALKTIQADKSRIQIQLNELAKLTNDITALRALRTELEKEVADLGGKLKKSEGTLIEEKKISESARAQVALLNQQTAALREQLAKISTILEASEKLAKERGVKISSLGKRLNAALAGKVHELSRYRSEFFGRLRALLGSHPGIRIVGDRFVFQSEVLFASGSAEIGGPGKEQLARLVKTLKESTAKIPADVDWVLRIDGHTDRIPIQTPRFLSNWELSAGRAISVVKFLVKEGIPPHRLVAAGFGEHQPLDPRNDEIAHRRNRRIEFKLTQR